MFPLRLNDLAPDKDPKGGSPTPPRGIRVSEVLAQPSAGDKNIWKTVAVILITADLTGFGGWIAFGFDSVKHSEIDGIMATRAPWNHDRKRIEDKISENERRIGALEGQHYELLKKKWDAGND